MANEIQIVTDTGITVYCVLLNENGLIWNGAGFVAINAVDWLSYDILLTEATAGIYLANMPAATIGNYMYVAYEQIGVNPAITDNVKGTGYLVWDGSSVISLNDIGWETLESLRSIIRQYNSVVLRNTSCNDIYLQRSADFEWEVFGVGDLTGRSKLYFTVKYMKEKDEATDAQSVIQIEETAGLLYINKTAGTPANGSITVTDALAGTMTIELDAAETDKLLPNESYRYDIKMDNTVMTEGKLYISSAITRTVT